VQRWQVSYDLAAGHKAGTRPAVGGRAPVIRLRCPACGASLSEAGTRLACAGCGRHYDVCDGIIDLADHG